MIIMLCVPRSATPFTAIKVHEANCDKCGCEVWLSQHAIDKHGGTANISPICEECLEKSDIAIIRIDMKDIEKARELMRTEIRERVERN